MTMKLAKLLPIDTNTEAKIKRAARMVFHKNGFAATRTRDIAKEAGINIALLNYYFRSKKRLFEIVMSETLFDFMQGMISVYNDENTTLKQKIEHITEKYIDLITSEPEIPIFIMSEIRNNPDDFFKKIPIQQLLMNSVFVKQFQQAVDERKISEANPLQFIANLMGLIIFPIMANPILKKIGNLNDSQFNEFIQERKKLIPRWVKSILKAS